MRQQSRRLGSRSRPASAVDPERLGEQRADGEPRAQRRDRVLEHHAPFGGAMVEARCPSGPGRCAVETDRAGLRPDQPDHGRAAERRLAAPAFADEAERAARAEREETSSTASRHGSPHAPQQGLATRPMARKRTTRFSTSSSSAMARADGSGAPWPGDREERRRHVAAREGASGSAAGRRNPRGASIRLGMSPGMVGSSRLGSSMRAGSQRSSASV